MKDKMKTDCIFCKIIEGKIPSVKIWEDKKHLAILDINPATKGHTLVIPKKHYETIFNMPKKLLKETIEVAQKIAKLLKEKLNAEGINLLNSNNKVAQQDVFHYHIHVIPRYSNEEFKIDFKNKTKNKNLSEVAKQIKQ